LAEGLISVVLRQNIPNDTQDQDLDDVIKRAFEEKDQDEKSKLAFYVTSFSQLFQEKNIPVDVIPWLARAILTVAWVAGERGAEPQA
jgi:hypothetical protein